MKKQQLKETIDFLKLKGFQDQDGDFTGQQ